MLKRSNIVSSLVALSTMCTGVVTLPQSCNMPAIFSSCRSSSVMAKPANGPSLVSLTASASIIVSIGTRWQCPPCRGLSSIAVLMSSMKDSNNSSSWLINARLVRAIAACEASDSARRWSASERTIFPSDSPKTIDQLQHADDFALMILHWNREKRLGPVPVF